MSAVTPVPSFLSRPGNTEDAGRVGDGRTVGFRQCGAWAWWKACIRGGSWPLTLRSRPLSDGLVPANSELAPRVCGGVFTSCLAECVGKVLITLRLVCVCRQHRPSLGV